MLLAPMAPHFCSELWNGLSKGLKVRHCQDFEWDKSLFHQKEHTKVIALKYFLKGVRYDFSRGTYYRTILIFWKNTYMSVLYLKQKIMLALGYQTPD